MDPLTLSVWVTNFFKGRVGTFIGEDVCYLKKLGWTEGVSDVDYYSVTDSCDPAILSRARLVTIRSTVDITINQERYGLVRIYKNVYVNPSLSKICIHSYPTKCLTNRQPPGFADFLRGTVTLYELADEHGFEVLINRSSHPIFKYLLYDSGFAPVQYNESTIEIYTTTSDRPEELIPPLYYRDIYSRLQELFKQGKKFNVVTNSFNRFPIPKVDVYASYSLLNASKEKLKRLLQPNDEIVDLLNVVKQKLTRDYTVVHLRFLDACLKEGYELKLGHVEKILNMINEMNEERILIISNFPRIKDELAFALPNAVFTSANPVHLGDLSGNVDVEQGIRDTLVDLFLIAGAKKIYFASQYNGSGFSQLLAKIYDIECVNYSDRVFN